MPTFSPNIRITHMLPELRMCGAWKLARAVPKGRQYPGTAVVALYLRRKKGYEGERVRNSALRPPYVPSFGLSSISTSHESQPELELPEGRADKAAAVFALCFLS